MYQCWFIYYLLRWYWDLNSGLHTSQTGTLSLEQHLPALFVLIIWQVRSFSLGQFYFRPPIVSGMTGVYHHCPDFFPVKWNLANFFAQAGLEP
jgi:hypothetical protein